MKLLIRVLFIFLLSAIWLSGPLCGKIPRRENDALQALFNAAGGGNWLKRDNWKGEPGTENTWYGLTCNSSNTTVLKIVLKDNRLTGTLPADLSDLSNLRTLVLSENQLNGLHPALGKLSNLTTLDLSNNGLSGPIPPWIAKLKNLKKLDLSYNRFTGGIPSWIGSLPNLEELRLDGNRLNGSIPKQLGNLSKLTVLRIGHNRLTGKIPAGLAELTRLSDNKSNFKWNGLYTANESLRAFLEKKQTGKDWENTQTVAPGGITAVSDSENTIIINWKPIPYTADGGGYHVFYGTTPGGPYDKPGGETKDKTESKLPVRNLQKSTTYYFVIRTRTGLHGSNRNRVESGFSREITAATRGTTISGYVTTPGNIGLPDVKLTASDNSETILTAPTGEYHLGVLPGWSGTVTPSKKGFNFSPAGKTYTAVKNDRDKQNYTADAVTVISGEVTDSEGEGIPGVTLRFSDSEEREIATAETDDAGNYSHIVTYNWAGTAKPSKDGYTFTPPALEYLGVTSARPGNEYKAALLPKIGGRVKSRGGKGIPGVSLTFTNKQTSGEIIDTDKKGNYSKLFMKDWSGVVAPAKKGYKFYPAKRKYKNMTLDTIKIKEHYKAEREFKFFVSVTGKYMIPAAEDVDEIYEKDVYYPGITAGYKISRGIYIWSGYGFLSKIGTVPVFDEPSKWTQNFLSLGLGFFKDISILFAFKAELGVSYVGFTEEAFGETVTGSAVGVRIGGALIFKVSDRLFTEISTHYLHASTTVNDIFLKLGGLKAGIGIGIRF